MAKIYTIGSTPETKVSECRPFDIQSLEVEKEYSTTYVGILKVLREAFSLVDITQIIKKL